MEQGNYKSLLLKLSGTALGLVVMLGGAVTLSQNFIAHKSMESPKNPVSVQRIPPPDPELAFLTKVLPEDLVLKITLNKEFKVVMDTGEWMDGEALKNAQLAVENLKLEHFGRMIDVSSDSIEELRETIEEIAHKITIPQLIKEEILANLERQLHKAEMKVNALEGQVAKFSYRVFLPQSKYTSNGKCTQQEIIVEKCTGGQCVEDGPEKKRRGDRKNSVAAFYWI